MNTVNFTTTQKWHADYKPNRQQASVRSDKSGWMEKVGF